VIVGIHKWDLGLKGAEGPIYLPRPIEVLAEIIHYMAAVAWDRDCSDVDLTADLSKLPGRSAQQLNFVKVGPPSRLGDQVCCWLAVAGSSPVTVAHWDPEQVAWIPSKGYFS
jgi:hypothetical protein